MIVIKKDEAMESVKNKAWYPPGCDNKDRHIDFLFNGCSEIDLVRCKDCRYLDVWNLKNIYAVCSKHGITFEPFEDDTRTHFCAWGEGREDG